VHDGVSVLCSDVCAWGNGVEVRSDISGSGINESLDLSLGVHRGGAHLIVQSVVAPALVLQISPQPKPADWGRPTVSGTIKLTVAGYSRSLAAEKPTLSPLAQLPENMWNVRPTLGPALGGSYDVFGPGSSNEGEVGFDDQVLIAFEGLFPQRKRSRRTER